MADVRLEVNTMNKGVLDNVQGVYPYSTIATNEDFLYNKYICNFNQVSSQYNTKKILGATIHIYAYPRTERYSYHPLNRILFRARDTSWSPSTVCYSDIRIQDADSIYAPYRYDSSTPLYNGTTWQSLTATYSDANKILKILNYGLEFIASDKVATAQYSAKFVSKSTNAPYLVVSFSEEDASIKISTCSPTGGYQAKQKACTFIWSTSYVGTSITVPTITNSKFRWRINSSATATEIDCGTALTYTMPANTVSTDSFQWQCQITDSNGTTSVSEWFTISTLEALSTAACIAPKNAVLDGSVQNEFSWSHIISTSTEQTGADLQYSDDNGTTWETLATITGSVKNTTVVANFFDSGDYVWRVRTYNTDNNAGAWSTACAFSVISAPPKPTVSSEQNPRPLVSWQSSDQQGYRVIIDDVYDSGIVYGESKSFRIGKYLDDGSYTVKVKIQNSYGIWSEEGSAPINVVNTAGQPMVLTWTINKNLELTWTQQLTYAYYLVYRDGVIIAKVRENSYIDATSIGSHTYFVRGIYASSQNYGLSNEVNAIITVDNPILTDLGTGVALELTTTDSSYSEVAIAESIVAVETNISSSAYPYVEMSKHKTKSVGFKVAYKYENTDRAIFESMLGREVSIKTNKGSIAVGTLLGISKIESTFFIVYEASLSQSAYDEEVKL